MYTKKEKYFMRQAINEAKKGISLGHGGPFGAVIVKEGKIIARGHNQVVAKNDPTLHGEIDAIRKACKKLLTFDLSGCDLYTTGEPCPMCLGAILWANINRVFYGATIEDNEKIGFRDNKFDKCMNIDRSKFSFFQIDRDKCLELFDSYMHIKDKIHY